MKKDRSIFFPLVLIAAGTLWILISMGRIPAENLWALAYFWPFLLVAAGLGLILRSFWAPARALVDLLVVGAAVLAILFAPQLGWTSPQWGLGFESAFSGGVRGSGKVITEAREVQDFLSISIAVPAEVTIQQGSSELVKIEAEDNLIPQLSTEIKAGALVIKNKVSNWNERVNATQPVRISITVKDLNSLEFSSAGEVRIDKLNTQKLNVVINGAGKVTINQLTASKLDCRLNGAGSVIASGSADDLLLVISGVGSFDGGDLINKTAIARISGAGSATVHPTNDLSAEISGTGSINYYGNPSLTQHISGIGSVSKIGE
jgi:hypothetical protein